MNIRTLSLIGASFVAMVFASGGSQAAVTVLGTGAATSCYQAAEYGNDAKSGIEACTLALDQQPLSVRDRAATYINRGILRSHISDLNGALRDYNQGLSIDADLSEGYVDRGAAYIAMHRYQDALDDINKGLKLGTNRPEIAYYDRAIADEALGNIRAAYEDYKQALAVEPNFTLASEQLTRFKVVRKSDSSM